MRSMILAVLTAAVALPPATAAKPNVVFILADDLGWADTTPYGSRFHDTPNVQKLARRAVRFTRFYAASPLCSPTRASILTGLYPARIGITAPVCHLPRVNLEKRLEPGTPRQRVLVADSLTRLRGEYVTLAERLREAGYATAHFGKWHLGHGEGYEPRHQGFDLDVPHTPRAAGPGGGYLAPWKFVTDPTVQGRPGEHIDEWMAGQAAAFIRRQRGRPFFVNFWLYSVHGPWNARTDLIDRFQKTADPKAAQRNPLYAAMVRSMDDAVGRLLEALDAAGVADNTIVVFTSDNGGWAFPPRATLPPGYEAIPATSNAPLRSGKASNYEGGIRVPCLIAWPGTAKPGVSEAPFSSVDFLPTLLAMTGTKPPTTVHTDGVDQVPALLGKGAPRDTVYVHFPHGSEAQERSIPGFWPGTSVRKGDWKLIRFYARNPDGSDRFELYDLRTDPGETTTRAADRPGVVKELSGLIDAFLARTEAVVPKANPAYRRPADGSGWTAGGDASLVGRPGVLVVSSAGKDPFLFTREMPAAAGPFRVEVRMRSTSRGTARVFWTTTAGQAFHRDRSVVFTPEHDDRWHLYEVRLKEDRALTGLRLDPGNAAGVMHLEFIRLKDRDGKVVKAWTFDRPTGGSAGAAK